METDVLLPLIGVGIVVVTAGLGFLWCVVATRRRRDWAQTTGTIVGSRVEVSTTSNGVSGTAKALVIEWRGADGAARRYVERFSMTRLRVPVGR